MFAQGNGGGDQALHRGQRPGVQFLGGQGGGQAAGVGDQAAHEPLAEGVVSGRGKEIVMAEPGGDSGAGDVGAMGDRVGGRAGDPLRYQGTGPQPGGIGAKGAQVAQPGEAVRAGPQDGGPAEVTPTRPGAAAGSRRRFPVRP